MADSVMFKRWSSQGEDTPVFGVPTPEMPLAYKSTVKDMGPMRSLYKQEAPSTDVSFMSNAAVAGADNISMFANNIKGAADGVGTVAKTAGVGTTAATAGDVSTAMSGAAGDAGNATADAAEGVSESAGKMNVDYGKAVGGTIDGINAAVSMHKDIGLSTNERMNEKGELTHEVQWGKNIATNTAAGMKAGSAFGPWGMLIGTAVGAIVGVGGSLHDKSKQPKLQDMIAKKRRFDLGTSINQIAASDTMPQQVQAAKYGMKYAKGTKEIEVERDEIVLRKTGNAYSMVADFRGGTNKLHEDGGEPYIAQEGDSIVPRNKSKKVARDLRLRNWRSIESTVQSLPTDKGELMVAANGVKKVVSKGTSSKKGKWTAEKVQEFIDAHVVEGKEAPITGEELLALANKYNFPIELALIQGAEESNFGTKGAATYTNNIYNWGNVTEGDTKTRKQALADGDRKVMGTVVKGVEEYMKGVNKNYLYPVKGDWKSLLETGFVNKNGDRYAKDETYEENLSGLLTSIEQDNYTTDNTSDATKPNNTQVNAASATQLPDSELTEEEMFWRYQNAVRHRGTEKGSTAHTKSLKARANLGEVYIPEGLGFWEENLLKAGNLIPQAAFAIAEGAPGRMIDAVTGYDRAGSFEELRFEDTPEGDALKKEYQDIILPIIDSNDFFSTAGAIDTANIIGKYTSNMLTGTRTSASDLYRGANMLSMYEGEDIDKIRAELTKKNISREGLFMFEDMVRSPQNYYSSSIEGAESVDALTLLLNPKGAATGLGKGLKALPRTLKKTVQVGKKGVDISADALKTAYTYIKGLDYKKLKQLPKYVWDNIGKMVDDIPTYSKGEDVMDALNSAEEVLKKAKAAGNTNTDEVFQAIKNNKTTWKDVQNATKKLGDKTSKLLFGSSFSEMKTYKAKIKKATGLDWSEVKTMSKQDIGKAIKKTTVEYAKKVDNIQSDLDKHWKNYKKKKADFLKKIDDDADILAKKDPEVMQLQDDLLGLEKQMDALDAQAETLRANKPMAFDKDYNLIPTEVIGKDGLPIKNASLSPEYAKVVDKLDDTADIYKKVNDLREVKTFDKYTELVQQGKLVEGKGTGAILKETRKGSVPIMNSKRKALADVRNMDDLKAEFPTIYNKLEAADRLKSIPKDLAGMRTALVQFANDEPNAGLLTTNPDGSRRVLDPDEIDGGTLDEVNIKGKSTKSTKSDMTPVDLGLGDIEGRPSDPVDPTKQDDSNKITGDDIEKKQKIGKAITSGMSTLASFAPAIYNIAKGLESPDKIQRRFVSPQTKEFVPMAQPQLNAIDDAFNTALGNARNLSGGMMSNFRSNTEKAWADKIARTGDVNAREAMRADQVASENIGIRNAADQYNTQANTKYDEIDMRSEAATNSFLAQGMADLSNIAYRNNTDRQKKANQDMMLKLVGTNDFEISPDGAITVKRTTQTPEKVTTPKNPFPTFTPSKRSAIVPPNLEDHELFPKPLTF